MKEGKTLLEHGYFLKVQAVGAPIETGEKADQQRRGRSSSGKRRGNDFCETGSGRSQEEGEAFRFSGETEGEVSRTGRKGKCSEMRRMHQIVA